ncbi:hypothetical protein [Leptotrichia sp. oral taxon 847]|uniref:hypothetical protein n=1 Tax=Leptotrichia sp. oral taxon 847 TaxID=1785996 RepID=UPI0007683C58|nr:hypothetical protein [Leptotrichia sp. oral taxon 847]AMD95355.1 hypothetical protein AXF11_07070 [Leptotrichia sp. oral taxon 847]
MFKLFKYDFRAISRRLVPLYLVAIVIGVVNQICSTVVIRMSNHISEGNAVYAIFYVLKMVFSFSFFLMMSYVSILTIFILITNFNNSVYGNEGYLINSLPISSKDLIFAKYFNFVFWTFVSGILYIIFYIIGVSNSILASGQNVDIPKSELDFMKQRIFSSPYFPKIVGIIIIVVICLILYQLLCSWIFMMCVTFANLVKSNKLIMGIVTYVITGVIIGIIYLSLMISFFLKVESLASKGNGDVAVVFDLVRNYGIICIIIEILLNIGVFFLINYIHSKKIDLE